MKNKYLAFIFIALVGMHHMSAQEAPTLPQPVKEHEWLQQFIGEWESETQVFMDPNNPLKGTGSETVRSLGGFWIVSTGKGEMAGSNMEYVMTLGYDPAKKKYVGVWADSMTSHLWNMEGSVDESGKVLTMESTGPCPMRPGQLSKFRDVTEFKSKDHRTFTSYIQNEDGEWTPTVKGEARRKK